MREELSEVREELGRVLNERRRLEQVFNELRDKIRNINEKCKLLVEEINNLKIEYNRIRDDIKDANEKLSSIRNNIKEKKSIRRKIYDEINTIKERANKPYRYVKNRLEELDKIIQLHPTEPDWEKKLIKEMKQLSIDMKIYKEIRRKREILMKIKLEEELLKFEASNIRRNLDEMRVRINNIRLTINEKKDKLDRLIKEKEEIKGRLNQIAASLNELRIRERKLVEYIRTYYETLKKEKEEKTLHTLKIVADEAKRKLKEGGKLTKFEIEVLSMLEEMREDEQ